MFEGHRVVVCIPSGRYRYMRVLMPYLLSERHADVIDEVRLWVNTDVPSDLEYFQRLELEHPKVVCVPNPGPLDKALYDAKRAHYQFNDGIYRFYRSCVDADTLYVKVDDDICFIHDDFFRNVLRATLEHERHSFACVANVFNIPYVSKLLQDRGTIGDALGHSTGDPRCPFACTNGEFAAYIHQQFLELAPNRIEELYFESHHLVGRQRIGTMAWTGRNFKQFNGNVGPRDEVELTTRIPETLKKPLWIVGDAVVSHFAFSHQRAVLEDQTDVLRSYLQLSVNLNGDVAS